MHPQPIQPQPQRSGDHLSPAGEYNLRLGVLKELRPELIATHQGEARVFEGHAFVVEAAVSVGGRGMKPGLNVYRCGGGGVVVRGF
jgi:DNA topoisomerase VI subunit B